MVVIIYKSERVAEERVEGLDALHEHAEVEGHGLAVEHRRVLQVAAEAALPHKDEVAGLGRSLPAPERAVGLEVHGAQVLGDVDGLLRCAK